jgi:hypothetical protein
VLAESVLGEGPLFGLILTLHLERKKEHAKVSPYKGTDSPMRALLHDPITLQKSPPPSPSHWGLEFQYMNFGGI